MSEEPGLRGTKAGRNEQRKITATLLNNLAVGCFLAAFLQPALAVIQAARAVTLADGAGSLILTAIGGVLFVTARTFAGRLED
jgi:hypothetical protein